MRDRFACRLEERTKNPVEIGKFKKKKAKGAGPQMEGRRERGAQVKDFRQSAGEMAGNSSLKKK